MLELKKIVILGVNGMAGHVLAEHFNSNEQYDVYGIARQSSQYTREVIDVTDAGYLKKVLLKIKPDVVINCVGSLITQSNSNITNAILINSYLPNLLAETGVDLNFKLIHISTDCVFSGKDGQYKEDAFRDGDNNYARTKSLGEVINDRDLTIRTSIIGPEIKKDGTGLFHWFLKQEKSIFGYTAALWSGVTTLELAKAIQWGIENNISGLYHITNGHSINKYELLRLFKKYTKKDILIKESAGKMTDKSLLDTRREINYSIPDYDIMVREMIHFMKKNQALYSQYKF